MYHWYGSSIIYFIGFPPFSTPRLIDTEKTLTVLVLSRFFPIKITTSEITFCVGEDGAEYVGLDWGLADETLVGLFDWPGNCIGRPSAGYSPTPLAANDSSMRPAIQKKKID